MSKYNLLWLFIKNNNMDECILTFNDIENILGFPIDHSFLSYKKELIEYGFEVSKISMKNKNVLFRKIVK